MMQSTLMSTANFPFPTVAASVRTTVLSVAVLAASVFLPAMVQAQVPPDIPPPGDTIYEVRLADGSVIIARIAEVNEGRVVLGGETRVSPRIKLMTENYLLPDAVGVALSGGIRVIGERFATEIGIVAAVSDGDASCCIPLINFSYAFGRK